MIDRTVSPKISKLEEPKIITPKSYKLDNGVKTHIIDGASQEVTNIKFVFPASTYLEPKRLVATFSASMLLEGTKFHSSKEIMELFNFYGIHVSVNNMDDYTIVEIQTINKFLDKAVEIIAEILRESIFPEHELETIRKQKIEGYLVNLEHIDYVAGQKFSERMFGATHPYGYIQTIDDYNDVTRDDLTKFYNQYYNIRNGYIVVSGNVDEKIVSKLNKYLGLAKKGNLGDYPKKEIETTKEKRVFIEKKDSLQAALEMGLFTINQKHPDYHKLFLLNTILGGPGFFNGRLMQSIREKKGYTYGIRSVFTHLKNGSYLNISSELKTGTTELAIKDIYFQIGKLKSKLIPESELAIAKNYVLSLLLRRFNGPFNQGSVFISALQSGIEYKNWYHDFFETINDATSEDLREMANKYLDTEKMIEVIVGRM
jgi:zinc protease